ncbi:MAG: hypothetical protein LBT30_04150 [Clostridiales bacterium]|jgi:hypothetical protein|nr:hypothetical protein [Clostridiales bacterium]
MINLSSILTKLTQKSGSSDGQTKEKEKELLDKLKELDAQFKESQKDAGPPRELGLDKLDYNISSDDELKKTAEEIAAKAVKDKYEALKLKNDGEINSLDEYKAALEIKKADDINALKNEIAELKKQADADVLKRGLQRSSIAVGVNERLDGAELAGAEAYTRDYNAGTAAIDKEIIGLKNRFETSVQDLEFDKAYETEQKLNALIKERDALAAEMIKYNNTVTEKENDYKMQYDKYVADMRAKESDGGMSGEKADSYGERYNLAYEFYAGLDKKTALELVSNNAYLKSYLGTEYYNKLKSAFAK